MAIQTNPIFKGFSGSVNRQLVFKQCSGKTVMCKFPDRSRVIYSTRQKEAQKRFKDAVSFARIVLSHQVLKNSYSIKALQLGFRSAWNVAVADFMSGGELTRKPKKIKFDKSLLSHGMEKGYRVCLFKRVQPDEPAIAAAPGQGSSDFYKQLFPSHGSLNPARRKGWDKFPGDLPDSLISELSIMAG